MVLKNIFFGLCIFLVSCSNTETIDLSTNADKVPETGQKLYRKYCQSCHGKKGDAGRGNAADLSTSAITIKEIKQVILKGNDKGMMAYENLLETKAEVDSLVQHVLTLRKK